MNIAVVIPTIRPENYKEFLAYWHELFIKHNVSLFAVFDGEYPIVRYTTADDDYSEEMYYTQHDIPEIKDIIYNYNDGVRNMGFAVVAKFHPEIQTIITLDDDCFPIANTDPIQQHLDALEQRVPISWMSTTFGRDYMRGFPYGVRDEAEVVLSHGVWEGVQDWDACTQLVRQPSQVQFYRGVVPKGILFPVCIMNVAFKTKLLPYYYQAPMGKSIGLDRFADIWSGINAKRKIDELGWAAVTGLSAIYHSRASNVYTNLIKEAKGIGLNEKYWLGDTSDPYFKLYHKNMKVWEKQIKKWQKQ